MTCIVGWAEKGKVYMGGDSAGVLGWRLQIRADEKVFLKSPFLIGFTESFRMGQLLRYRLALPERDKGLDVFEYMATQFVDAVRECLKAGGVATKEKEVESGGEFMVGYEGRLFIVYSDYQVSETVTRYAAIGVGAQLAMGAMFALNTKKVPAYTRLRQALLAAEAFNIGVRGPFVFKELGK